mgnify:CR=1 FL=1
MSYTGRDGRQYVVVAAGGHLLREGQVVPVRLPPEHLHLFDAEGVALEPSPGQIDPKMLRIVGKRANVRIGDLTELLDAAPALTPQVKEAEWVGNRRWNLTFTTGQLLALPEGEVESATALVKFARLDGKNRLLGGKVIAFDMRTPPRLYLRLPDAVGKPKVVAADDEGETT